MFDIYKKELLCVEVMDWALVDMKYDEKYRNKIVHVANGDYVLYVPEDGTMAYTILGGFKHKGEELNAKEALHVFNEKVWSQNAGSGSDSDQKEEPLLNIEELVSLKQAGFSVDDIIKMKKERVF